MQIEEIKDQICDVCHKMWQLGWVAANDGNVSVTVGGRNFPCNAYGHEQELHHAGQAAAY